MNKILNQIFDRIIESKRVAAQHFLISFVSIGLFLFLLISNWYPDLSFEILEAKFIVSVIFVVDVICGPLLTLILYSKSKKPKEKIIDFSFIILIQLSALIYGASSLYLARPIAIVFQVNDFKIVTKNEIYEEEIDNNYKIYDEVISSPMKPLGTREFITQNDKNDALSLSMQGFEISTRPSWWISYKDSIQRVLAAGKDVKKLIEMHPESKNIIIENIKKIDSTENELLWLPLVSRKQNDWVVFIDKSNAEIKGYIHLDGY